MSEGIAGGIAALLAPSRLAPYLEEADSDQELALELYAWNVEVSSACMEVLAYLEVLLRTAMDRELAAYARETKRGIPWFMLPGVTGPATEMIARDIEATRSRLRNVSDARDTRDQIIAGLSFGFWTALFGSQHEELWRAALCKALPGTPAGRRKAISAKLDRLRPLRNRIAHHDSLLRQDVLFLLEEMLTLAEWVDPAARRWLETRQQVIEVFGNRPVMGLDTLVVPAEHAWPLYEQVSAYVCPAGRSFRPVEFVAFYADKEIKSSVAGIIHHRDNVEWSDSEADRLGKLTGDEHRFDRKIATVISTSRSVGDFWKHGRYQVFLLTRPGDARHIGLKSPIPHLATGRGSAYVQRHRYISHHSLRSASDTSQLR
ncbi:hypothetical protein ACFYTF_24820 [Nocardia thailandica]|uniref:Abi-like protein n=1 Tax=Nocardia thailandica TaxID=257275 RepID=A0ABW6PUG2_9NOCA